MIKFSKISDSQLFFNPFHGKFYCHQSRNWPTHVKKLFHCSTWSAWKWLKRVISWLIITMYSWWIHTSRLRSRINYFWDISYLLFLVKMKNMDKCWIEKAFKYSLMPLFLESLSRDERMLRWSRYMQSSQLNMNLSEECLYDAKRSFMSHQRLWEVFEDPSIGIQTLLSGTATSLPNFKRYAFLIDNLSLIYFTFNIFRVHASLIRSWIWCIPPLQTNWW